MPLLTSSSELEGYDYNIYTFSATYENGETYYFLCAKSSAMWKIVQNIDIYDLKVQIFEILNQLKRERHPNKFLIQIRIDNLSSKQRYNCSLRTVEFVKQFTKTVILHGKVNGYNSYTWNDFKNFISK